jgi:nitroreductase
MDVFTAIKTRQSIRAYQPEPVEPDKLQTILRAINQAPSAGNLQAYRVFIVREDKVKRALAKAAWEQNFLVQAPVVLVFCADPARSAARYSRRGEQLYGVQDATIAVAYAQLAATALGLATCWVGAFEDAEVARVMQLPHGLRPVAVLPIGYPAESPPRTPRRPSGEIITEFAPPPADAP